MENESPIVGTIVVTHRLARGVMAKVNGQTRWFPSLEAVFRAALALQDTAVETTMVQGTMLRERKRP